MVSDIRVGLGLFLVHRLGLGQIKRSEGPIAEYCSALQCIAAQCCCIVVLRSWQNGGKLFFAKLNCSMPNYPVPNYLVPNCPIILP